MKIEANDPQLRDRSGGEARGMGGERELERIVFFSDAVFAIAITLLVLDIRVPSIPQDLAASELPQALAALWPKFLSYIISFVVIGLYCWQVHHRTFRYITGYDDRLVAFVNPAASLLAFVLLGPIRLVLTLLFKGRGHRPTKQEASR